MIYNWQQSGWGKFSYDEMAVEALLFAFSERSGRVSGLIEGLPQEVRSEAIIDLMVIEAIKTSEIEGEYLSRQDVMSSIRNNLGLHEPKVAVKDRRANGAARLMLAARDDYDHPLSKAVLFDWHEKLLLGARYVTVGDWRSHEEPMQVVSGPIGKEKVHFEAPPSADVQSLMDDFFQWFNVTSPSGNNPISKAPIRSAIAHLYFESIHPFEDGNGRIGRAISEKALSQGLGRPVLLSLSRSITKDKNAYYDALKTGQRSNEITPWLLYFVQTCLDAQIEAEAQIEFTLKKAQFFDHFREALNERQLKVLVRMFEAGLDGFEGGMSAKKYVSITSTSKPTATRDLQQLVEIGAVKSTGGGRSTRYWLPSE